ncbi:MAG: hypothetical protein FJ245_15710, partial [Nitrospira sp.]|nr:hypothetical protein [Nitrospira sp.]
MKVLIVEQLNHRILSQHSSIVADADVCLSISVSHGSAAEQALGDARWQVVSLPAHERAIARHAAWAHELAMSQRLGDRPLPARYESLVCYGLEFRLRPAALALAFLKETAKARGCSLDQIEVRIVADDPYLRDAFTRPDGIAAQLKSVALRSSSRPAAVVGTLKEQLAASRMVRRLALAWAGGTLMRSPWPLGKRQTTNRKRTAALFVLSQHYRDLFQPIRALLISRGWRVPVFCYNPIEDSGNDAELFDDAVRKTGGGLNEALVTPEWNISVNFLRESPVSSRWLRVVLDASWLTGWDKILRHQRVLSSLQPNVVISYSLDTMGLGLRGAADSLGIPSLFINHGPQGPVPSSWIFRWTASALAGQPCVAANTVDPFSIRHSGLVAVGYPPYDAILARAAALGDRRSEIASLGQPAERPYVVVVFAEYGSLFWVHALQ